MSQSGVVSRLGGDVTVRGGVTVRGDVTVRG